MDLWMIIVAVFIVAIVGVLVNLAIISDQKNDFIKLLGTLDDFDVTDLLIGEDGNTGFAYDNEHRKICLLAISAHQPTAWVYDYKDVLSCELYEDGNSINKTSRMSQVGGALIGGVIFGGVGAIIGGLSGKTKTTNSINRIDLRMVINDSQSPIHDINLLNIETSKSDIVYKSSIEKARRWHGILTVIIKRADKEDEEKALVPDEAIENEITSQTLSEEEVATSSNLINDLSKLGDLLDRGILTNEEFQLQKKKLLSH